jgi:hypothetical protein
LNRGFPVGEQIRKILFKARATMLKARKFVVKCARQTPRWAKDDIGPLLRSLEVERAGFSRGQGKWKRLKVALAAERFMSTVTAPIISFFHE